MSIKSYNRNLRSPKFYNDTKSGKQGYNPRVDIYYGSDDNIVRITETWRGEIWEQIITGSNYAQDWPNYTYSETFYPWGPISSSSSSSESSSSSSSESSSSSSSSESSSSSSESSSSSSESSSSSSESSSSSSSSESSSSSSSSESSSSSSSSESSSSSSSSESSSSSSSSESSSSSSESSSSSSESSSSSSSSESSSSSSESSSSSSSSESSSSSSESSSSSSLLCECAVDAAGAGTATVNDEYDETGLYNGKTMYIGCANNNRLWWSGAKWIFSPGAGDAEALWYYYDDGGTDAWDGNWAVGIAGTGPVPTVASC